MCMAPRCAYPSIDCALAQKADDIAAAEPAQHVLDGRDIGLVGFGVGYIDQRQPVSPNGGMGTGALRPRGRLRRSYMALKTIQRFAGDDVVGGSSVAIR